MYRDESKQKIKQTIRIGRRCESEDHHLFLTFTNNGKS